ncbi:MAG TPA: M20/M25/M40 family metallo-hydrolase [Planctomycetota bacterium]|nr:M20/M25/M40 family metallo-hydrolase [Planctomycetota bacterium]
MNPLPAAVPFCCLLAAPVLFLANAPAQANASQANAAIVERIAAALAAVDKARIEATVRALVGFGTRHVLSRTDSDTEGTGAARKWLQSQFEAVAAQSGGRLTVSLQAETVPCARQGMPKEVPIVNVIARLQGSSDAARVYVIGGHYDSRNSRGNDGVGAAPGAVDDASGTAVALEACRVMSTMPLAATVIFVAFDGEEQGLLGSAAHAKSLASADIKVDGMIGCDIVGNTLGMDGVRYDRHVRCFSYAPSGNDSIGRSMARAVSYAAATHLPAFGVKLILRGDRYGRGGDHRSFFEQGVPAVRLTEPREDFSRQHQNITEVDGAPYGDVPEFADFAYIANVTRVVVATLAELASAPPPPLVVSAQLRRDRYDTELVYELPSGVERCEFVWRETTAADWTHTIDMAAAKPSVARGNRWRACLEGVCLDDAVVGVRSVGPDGSRSRVATPPEPDRLEQRGAATPRRTGGEERDR